MRVSLAVMALSFFRAMSSRECARYLGHLTMLEDGADGGSPQGSHPGRSGPCMSAQRAQGCLPPETSSSLSVCTAASGASLSVLSPRCNGHSLVNGDGAMLSRLCSLGSFVVSWGQHLVQVCPNIQAIILLSGISDCSSCKDGSMTERSAYRLYLFQVQYARGPC